jgi:hypothetical protein
MKAPFLKQRQSSAPAFAKGAVWLAGVAYSGFVTTLFEQQFGWHLAPIGLLMLFGSLYLGEWVERRLGNRVS